MLASGGRGGRRELARDVGGDGSGAVEILRGDLGVVHVDREALLGEGDELEHAGRVGQAGLEQRLVAVELLLVRAEQEGLFDELPDLGYDVAGHAAVSWSRIGCEAGARAASPLAKV